MASVDTAKETIMYEALVRLPHVFLCYSNTLKIVNDITLYLRDIFLSIDFKTITQTQIGNYNIKAELIINNCGYCPMLHRVQAQKDVIEFQKIILLKNCIYFLAYGIFGGTSLCHNHLKLFCYCLNTNLYLNYPILNSRIRRVQGGKKELAHVFFTKKERKYFNKNTLLLLLYLIFEVIKEEKYLSLF